MIIILSLHAPRSFSEPLMDSCRGPTNVGEINKGPAGVKSLELPVDEAADTIKWRIPGSDTAGTHILKKLISQFIKEIVEGMIGYVRLPTIMSKLLSDNGTQEFGDFKLTILGMLGTYGFERRILVMYLRPSNHINPFISWLISLEMFLKTFTLTRDRILQSP